MQSNREDAFADTIRFPQSQRVSSTPKAPLDLRAAILGCLLGGATGDALGAPLEFMSWNEIRDAHGVNGLRDYHPAYGGIGRITDDTQMALFTAEGLLRARVRQETVPTCHVPSVVHHAYLRWLLTQAVWPIADVGRRRDARWPDGWLVCERAIWSLRNPCGTCLDALACAEHLGEPAHNAARDGGALARMAPVGLLAPKSQAFDLAGQLSRLTHAHPTARFSAGYFAELIALVATGEAIPHAVQQAKERLAEPAAAEVLSAVRRAQDLAASGQRATPSQVESLGRGVHAAEAVAITVYCALVAENFAHGVLLAINHGGKSDTTGAMVGSLLGTALGLDDIPTAWMDRLELHDAIVTMAGDIGMALEGGTPSAERYPGW